MIEIIPLKVYKRIKLYRLYFCMIKWVKTVLSLLGDNYLSSTFFSCFWILFHNSTALTVIEYFSYLFASQKSFMKLPCVELEVS